MRIILAAFFAATISAAAMFSEKKDEPAAVENIFASQGSVKLETHDAKHAWAKEDIDRYVQSNLKESKEAGYIGMGITSHHLPNALPLIFKFYQSVKDSVGPRETFVVLAPDHLERCQNEAVITWKDYETPYGRLEIDRDLAKDFSDVGISDGKDCFEGDHSVGAQAVMIKKFFPQSKILPVVLSSGSSMETKEKITRLLYDKREKIFVLGSMDFSHHNSFEKALMIDDKTQNIIENLEQGQLTLENIDSPPAGEIILGLARQASMRVDVIDRKNSAEFSGKQQDTTGYFSVVFLQK